MGIWMTARGTRINSAMKHWLPRSFVCRRLMLMNVEKRKMPLRIATQRHFSREKLRYLFVVGVGNVRSSTITSGSVCFILLSAMRGSAATMAVMSG